VVDGPNAREKVARFGLSSCELRAASNKKTAAVLRKSQKGEEKNGKDLQSITVHKIKGVLKRATHSAVQHIKHELK